MDKIDLLENIQGKLIVSCQARIGWAMYGPNVMAAFAKAAKEGGAAGIRASGKENIEAIQAVVDLPIIGINKVWTEGYDVYITPTYESAKEILETNLEIIALDATDRKRPNNETFEEIITKIRENYPNVLIMAEVSTVFEALRIKDLEIDLISTTLNGYTEETKNNQTLSLELVRKLKMITDIPIIAEGRVDSPKKASEAIKAGAFAVVVGTAITRPEIITKKFTEELNHGK